jgi:hypothetical protein
MSQPQESQKGRVRRVRIERSAAVRECTLHDVIVPDHISDDAAADWALARAEAGALPAAVQERVPTMLAESEPTFRATQIAQLEPSDPTLSQGAHVAANEPDSALALRFLTPAGATCTIVGLTQATLTYEWIRAGEEGEHLACISADDGAILATERPCQSHATPAWYGRFSRSAQALGGTFSAVEVIAGAGPLAVSAWSGNDENVELTLEQTEPQLLPGGARLTADGLRDITDGSVIITLDPARGYWMLAGNCYSDVTISRP